MRRFLAFALTDLLLLILAFGLVHLLNYGHLQLSGSNQDLLQIHLLLCLAMSLLWGKYSRLPRLSLIMGAGLLLKVGLYTLFVLSLIIVGLHLSHFSRTMAYGTILAFLALETGLLILYHAVRGPVPHPDKSSPKALSLSNISPTLLILDGALLLAAYLLVTFIKRGSLALSSPYDNILLILLGLWLAGSVLTQKFQRHHFDNFPNAFGPAVKTALIMAMGLAFFIFLLRLGPISRFQAFGAIPVLLFMEALVFQFYVIYRRQGRMNGDIVDPEEVRSMLRGEQGQPLLTPLPARPVVDPADEKLRYALDFFDPKVYAFLRETIDLSAVDRSDCTLMSTDDLFNLNALETGQFSLIVNLHKLNDIRWLNRYLLLAHEKLASGGHLMGMAHTHTTRRDYYRAAYPPYISPVLNMLDFLWARAMPKTPWLKKVYFTITRGRGRMVSRAEVLGRLCFCGYDIVAEQEIDHRLFFIARKSKQPSVNPNPTYGPLVMLQRTGLAGRPITVYKFRTMHPYSEYLQEYVYKHTQLEKGGKFKDDFRVTKWGRFMRRTWLDELPMLYNWVNGDLALIGVRPLSRQYLELYSPELQKFRQQIKPGLLPPFYADMPDNLEEIEASERRYIEAYLKNPLSTQVKYFFRCVWNIVVKRARSA